MALISAGNPWGTNQQIMPCVYLPVSSITHDNYFINKFLKSAKHMLYNIIWNIRSI
jgi:hypothetical protein